MRGVRISCFDFTMKSHFEYKEPKFKLLSCIQTVQTGIYEEKLGGAIGIRLQ